MKQIAQFNGSVKEFKEYLKYLFMIEVLRKLQLGELSPEELAGMKNINLAEIGQLN